MSSDIEYKYQLELTDESGEEFDMRDLIKQGIYIINISSKKLKICNYKHTPTI